MCGRALTLFHTLRRMCGSRVGCRGQQAQTSPALAANAHALASDAKSSRHDRYALCHICRSCFRLAILRAWVVTPSVSRVQATLTLSMEIEPPSNPVTGKAV